MSWRDCFESVARPCGADFSRSMESYVEATTVAFSVTTFGGSLPRPLLGACTDLDLSSFQISSTLAILVLDGLRADHQKSATDTLPRSIQPSLI